MPRPILTYNLQIALSVANSLLHFNLYSFWVRQQVFYNSSHYINKSSLESRGKSMKCAKSCPTTQVYIEARWTTKSFRTVDKKKRFKLEKLVQIQGNQLENFKSTEILTV